MPFGLTSATEVFQKKNEAAFAGIEGIHIVADDITEEHNMILQKVFVETQGANIKFNFDKLQLWVSVVKYLGAIISAEGVKPDSAKIAVISNIPIPTDKSAVRHLLSMANFIFPMYLQLQCAVV